MKKYFSLIKFSHTIFAMPFALLGFFLATLQPGLAFSWKNFFLIILSMIFARSAAMAFNRFLDRDIDRKNPRTQQREIPAGLISSKAALFFVLISSALFILTTFLINKLVFFLSPIALLVVLGYSYTKRFTYLCHFVLGLGLSLAPIGAYLAQGGGFDLIPILYSVVVLLWVSGFDIIYALQDEEFDRSLELHSIPTVLGRVNALRLSVVLHGLAAVALLIGSWLLQTQFEVFGWLNWVGACAFVGLLAFQHSLVKANDLSRVNLAFFTTNGIASVIFATCLILDVYV